MDEENKKAGNTSSSLPLIVAVIALIIGAVGVWFGMSAKDKAEKSQTSSAQVAAAVKAEFAAQQKAETQKTRDEVVRLNTEARRLGRQVAVAEKTVAKNTQKAQVEVRKSIQSQSRAISATDKRLFQEILKMNTEIIRLNQRITTTNQRIDQLVNRLSSEGI